MENCELAESALQGGKRQGCPEAAIGDVRAKQTSRDFPPVLSQGRTRPRTSSSVRLTDFLPVLLGALRLASGRRQGGKRCLRKCFVAILSLRCFGSSARSRREQDQRRQKKQRALRTARLVHSNKKKEPIRVSPIVDAISSDKQEVRIRFVDSQDVESSQSQFHVRLRIARRRREEIEEGTFAGRRCSPRTS